MRSENSIAYPEGDLMLDQAVQVMTEGEKLLADGVTVFDLSGLGHVNSVALSVLMNWDRYALEQGHDLEFRNTPENLISLATLYGVADLIHLA